MPDEVKGNDSQVKLGYTLPNGEGGLNQHWTLASGFKIDAGTVTVKIPADLETRSTYQVVLFGDSGNTSPEFTINGVAPDPLEAVTSEGFPSVHKILDQSSQMSLSKNVELLVRLV